MTDSELELEASAIQGLYERVEACVEDIRKYLKIYPELQQNLSIIIDMRLEPGSSQDVLLHYYHASTEDLLNVAQSLVIKAKEIIDDE